MSIVGRSLFIVILVIIAECISLKVILKDKVMLFNPSYNNTDYACKSDKVRVGKQDPWFVNLR